MKRLAFEQNSYQSKSNICIFLLMNMKRSKQILLSIVFNPSEYGYEKEAKNCCTWILGGSQMQKNLG